MKRTQAIETRSLSDVSSLPTRPTDAGTYVSVQQALSVGVVYRAVQILSTSVAQQRLTVFRRGMEVKQVPGIVKQPDLDSDQGRFIEETVISLATYGEAFWRLYGSPTANIRVLNPEEVLVQEHSETGRIEYWHRGKQIPSDQIRHLKLMSRPGHVNGFGPIQAASQEIGALVRLRKFADTWFDTSGVPSGYLTSDEFLTQEDSTAYAQAWKQFLANNDGFGVLGSGIKYVPLTIDPEKAQFVAVQRQAVTNIARLFGIPAALLLAPVDGSSETYQNQEDAFNAFLTTTLAAYMNEIERAFTSLLPRGQEARFVESDLLRLDATTLWSVRSQQVALGYFDANDLREMDGLPAKAIEKAPVPLSGPETEEEDPSD
ncbi:phage portal protein [Nocardioides sp. NBC_00368]|uniref:phage portal protein n=1 Tax=Nocardioides sp. NBC_00368 TaxID=2976000 RepID=UPI002E22E523